MKKPFKKLGSSIILTLGWCFLLYGQASDEQSIQQANISSFQSFTEEDGFEVKDILSLAEDYLGRLWVIGQERNELLFETTNNENEVLWRFDGNGFSKFELPILDFTPNHLILQFIGNHTMLIESGDGAYNEFDTRTFKFGRHIILPNGQDKFTSALYRNGALYLMYQEDSYQNIWKQDAHGFEFLFKVPIQSGHSVIYPFNDEIFLSYYLNGIYRYSEKGQLLKAYGPSDFSYDKLKAKNVSFINANTKNGKMYVSSRGMQPGIQEYDPIRDNFRSVPGLPSDTIASSQYSDDYGNVVYIFGGVSNFYHMILETNEGIKYDLDTILTLVPKLHTISSKNYSKYFWIGGQSGLHLCNLESPVVNTYRTTSSIRAISRIDPDFITFATETDGWFDIIPSSRIVRNSVIVPGLPHGNRGLYYYDNTLITNSFNSLIMIKENEPPHFSKLPMVWPESMTQLPNGNILFANNSGTLVIIDISTLQSELQTLSFPFEPQSNFKINALVAIGEDEIIIGTSNGLWRYNLSTQVLTLCKTPQNSEDILGINLMENKVFTGTFDGRVDEYSLTAEREISHIRSFDIGSPVATMTADNQQNLWLGTFYGVKILDLQTGRVRHISNEYVAHYESNRHSAFFDSVSNSMFIGSIQGLTEFSLESYAPVDTTDSSLLISSIDYYEKDSTNLSTIHPVAHTIAKVKIPAENKFVRIKYWLLNETNTPASKYMYRFSDQSEEWLDYGNNTEIIHNGLGSGVHTLEIRAFDHLGIQSGKDAIVEMEVGAFFYQTAWFYSALGLFFGGLLFIWLRRNILERKKLESEVQIRTFEIQKDKETIEHQAVELKALDKLKNRFFANISHELRTPLTLILGPLQKSIQKQNDEPVQKSMIETAIRNAHQLKEHIDELLDLSKLESGKLGLHKTPTNLHSFLKRLTGSFESYSDHKDIEYVQVIDISTNIETLLDQPKVSKMINNLITNAFKFSEAGGKITVNAQLSNEKVFSISVSDSGIGIAEKDQPYIFDRYYQSKDSGNQAAGGSGIGLALVKEYAKLMAGDVWVSSELGEGSTFLLEIPVEDRLPFVDTQQFPFEQPMAKSQEPNANSQQQKANSKSADSQQPTAKSKKPMAKSPRPNILIVEDHDELRHYLESIISEKYNVVAHEDGLSAWEYLQTDEAKNVDLVLSDVMMPRMDGFELLSKIKEDASMRLIPFIFLTARAAKEDRIHALRIGVDDYLLKPFEEEELLVRIQNLLTHQKERIEGLAEETETSKSDQEGAISKLSESNAPAENILLVEEIKQHVLNHLADPTFSIDFIAEKMNLGRRSLHRLLKKETGLTPNHFIREIRLIKARDLLESREMNKVQDVSLAVGFYKTRYFSDLFKERFGKLPSTYL